MTGVRVQLENNFFEDDKFDGLSDAAFKLWIVGLCYANRNLTDGRLVGRALDRIAFDAMITEWRTLATELVQHSMWTAIQGGFQIVNYGKYQMTRSRYDEYRDKRNGTQMRRELFRGDVASTVKSRDGSDCRYCGMIVSWVDKRSPGGATYDHVDPAAGTVVENVVIACRGCNSKKGERTPEQAGMVLLPPPDRPTPTPYGRESIPEPDQELTIDSTPTNGRGVYQSARDRAWAAGTRCDPLDLEELRSRTRRHA